MFYLNVFLCRAESSKSSETLSKTEPMTCKYIIVYLIGIYAESPHRKEMDRNDLFAFSGTAVNMLLAFSVRRNLRQICDKSIGEDTISTVHGLRSLSMVWIVLGHVCIVSFKYSGNYLQLIIILRSSLYHDLHIHHNEVRHLSYNKYLF